MAKIISKALKARMDRAVKLGRAVPLEEVSRGAEVNRNALARLEAGDTQRFDGPMLARLCVFYGLGVGDLLEIDLNASYEEDAESPTYEEYAYAE